MSKSPLSPKFRVSFPFVFKPQINKKSGKEEFTVMALFPLGADLTVLKDAAKAALIAKWGADQNKWPNLRSPFRDQVELKKDGVQPEGTTPGAIFVRFKSKQKPGVVNEMVQKIIDPKEFYAGCWAQCSFSTYTYDTDGNRGVAFGLNNIQKIQDDKPLSSAVSNAEDDFAPIAGAVAAGSSTPTAATSLFD